jgi:hypothetical protein
MWNQVDFSYFNMGAYWRIVENRTMIVDLTDRLLDGLFAVAVLRAWSRERKWTTSRMLQPVIMSCQL